MFPTRSQLRAQQLRVLIARRRAREAQALWRRTIRDRAVSPPALAAGLVLGFGIGRGLKLPEGRATGRLLYWLHAVLPLLRLL